MVFSSIIFTYLFLPVVLGLYYLVRNHTARNCILLAASIFFYAYGEPKFVLVMLASIAANYVLALLIDRLDGRNALRKTILVLSVIVNVGILFVFKYLGFAVRVFDGLSGASVKIPDIALPIGISFFTFQAMSYVIDVYRKDVPVQKNPLRLALYIAFFPQLIAGPIVRYNQIAEQIETPRQLSLSRFGYGARRFMTGFIMKVLIANHMALACEKQFLITDFATLQAPVLWYWIGAAAYSLQIFFDFAGYSEMAIGLGQMFGFSFEENFNYPYMASSVTDFWRRWHISLSRWFRDYVYIPLGGSRVSVPRHIFNLFVVWLLTGLWHGANETFLVWGLVYFVLLVFEKYVAKPWARPRSFRIFWRIFTIVAVMYEWVMFRAVDVAQGVHYWLALSGFYTRAVGPRWPNNVRLLREYGIYLALGILFSFPIGKVLRKAVSAKPKLSKVCDVLVPVGYAAVFLIAVSFLILGAHNPFIYFNF